MNSDSSQQPPFLPSAYGQQPPPGPPIMPPWERAEEMGYLQALFQTIRAVLFHPAETFRYMLPQGNLGKAFLYALIMNAVIVLLRLIAEWLAALMHFSLWSFVPKPAEVNDLIPQIPTAVLKFQITLLTLPLYFVLGLVTAAAGLLIRTAIIHVCLLLFGAVRYPFEATFRVVCYANGSTMIWNLPIFCCFGPVIAAIWQFYSLMYGLSEVHRVSTGRTALALILPSLLMLVCCGGLLFAGYFAYQNFHP